MLAVRKYPSDSRHVAGQLVGEYHPWVVLAAIQYVAQEALSGRLVAALLNQGPQSPLATVWTPPGQARDVSCLYTAWSVPQGPDGPGIHGVSKARGP